MRILYGTLRVGTAASVLAPIRVSRTSPHWQRSLVGRHTSGDKLQDLVRSVSGPESMHRPRRSHTTEVV